ncbi:MAG: ribosome silencing factor [Eubacteriales bacterium]
MEDNKTKILTDALLGKKASNVMLIDIKDKTTIADAFIIASGNSATQVKALYDEIRDKADENNLEIRASEGYDSAKWIIVDVEGIMIHIFYYKDREFYNIERLWIDDDNVQYYKES